MKHPFFWTGLGIAGLAVLFIVGGSTLKNSHGLQKTDSLPLHLGQGRGTSQIPEFVGISRWWNTIENKPLTKEALNGKVVLVDFWTYSCINCLRTLPFLKQLHERYADQGLVIVGVHTPEFAFEGVPENVDREITKNGLKYPIALDADRATWDAYANQYWPAEYLFDQQGKLVHTHFGEGGYGETEELIRGLLQSNTTSTLASGVTPNFDKIATSETYFGLARSEHFHGGKISANQETEYAIATALGRNEWSVGGIWKFENEYTVGTMSGDVFRMNVTANKMHLVLGSTDGKEKNIDVYVDGKQTSTITVKDQTLYTIAAFETPGTHVVELRLGDDGVRFYSVTFS